MNKLNAALVRDVFAKRQRWVTNDAVALQGLPLANPALLCGIEIELEDWRSDAEQEETRLHYWWVEHNEPSLRNGREFVLAPPRNGAELLEGVERFFDVGATWTASDRASVHIHMDMGNSTVGQFRSMAALVYALEGAIYRVADENRKWASYCCPLIDMRPERLMNMVSAESAEAFKRACVGDYHEEKYYGFNAVSLSKHLTIEMRYFPCTTDKDVLYKWLNMCIELHTAGHKFESPDTLAALVAEMSLPAFLEQYMPMSAEHLMVYLDTEEAMRRLRELSAIHKDAALRGRRWVVDLDMVNGASFNQMLENVLGDVYKKHLEYKKAPLVEISPAELYNKLLENI